MYCLLVNVYCTAATGCQPNCSQQIYQYQIHQSAHRECFVFLFGASVARRRRVCLITGTSNVYLMLYNDQRIVHLLVIVRNNKRVMFILFV
jgi:hypothetical protein